ncbi:uncharacterized protein LOC116432668 [Nomia melanderi]|uniref:uncharacterized protein LOC116432668 n=1 Tax=Nomia melanderi TaxID=2448451 RepID=UPI003FCC716B
MYSTPIFLLLLFGALAQCSSFRDQNRNDTLILSKIVRRTPNSLLLVSPKQVKILERTIKRFLSKTAQPIDRPILLKSKRNNMQLSIRCMCDSMRNSLMEFAKDCNLTASVLRYKQSPSELPVSTDWFSEVLLQITFLLRDVGDMINEIGDKINKHFGGHNTTSRKSQQLIKESDGFEFMGVVYDAADFAERLSRCLLRMSMTKRRKSSIDLNHVVLNITKNTPELAVKIFESSFQNTSPDDIPKNRAHKSWHGYLCVSLIKEREVDYDDCVRDLQNLDKCLRSLKRRSESHPRNIEEKRWLRAIEQLSDCDANTDERGKQKISCRWSNKMPRTVQQKVKFSFEKMFPKRIPKRSPFHRAVRDLSYTLSKKSWGQRFANELCQFCMIYDDGLKKFQKVSAIAARDRSAVAKQRKLHKALQVYRRGIFERLFGAIGGLHRSMTEFEKFLVHGIQNVLNESWQSHVRILSCMIEWMNQVLQFYSDDNSNYEQKPVDTSTAVEEANGSDDSSSDYSSSDEDDTAAARSAVILKRAEASMDNLIESMDRVGKTRSTNDTSLLAGLANNLLLVTMFIETLGFVSTLYCFGHGMKNETQSLNFEEDRGLARRAVIPLDSEGPFDSISKHFDPFEAYENLTVVIYN